MKARRFVFGRDLTLVIRASRGDLHHFEAEYGAGDEWRGGDANLVVTLTGDEPTTERYKTVRWGLSVDARSIVQAHIRLRGRPRSFGLSLVQGYFVEPLLSLTAPRTGHVLLPAAGLSMGGRTVILMGRSRVGKSSVAARALAAGHGFLGDDQVLVNGLGRASAFPRRLRLYSDVRYTAPAAYSALRARTRAALLLRAAARAATRGYVAPPVRVRPTALGAAVVGGDVEVDEILHVVRGSAREVGTTPLSAETATERAAELLRLQRARLVHLAPSLATTASAAAATERTLLLEFFSASAVSELLIPSTFAAPSAIATLSQRLGIVEAPTG